MRQFAKFMMVVGAMCTVLLLWSLAYGVNKASTVVALLGLTTSVLSMVVGLSVWLRGPS